MKQLITTAALLLTTVFSFTAKSQISEADKKAIEKIYSDATAAFEKMDVKAIAGIYTENGVHVDPTGKIVRGKSALENHYANLFNYFKSLPKPDKTTHQDTDWQSHYIAPGIISVSYTSEDIDLFGDKARSTKFSIALTLIKKNGNWLADQIAMTPVTEMPEL